MGTATARVTLRALALTVLALVAWPVPAATARPDPRTFTVATLNVNRNNSAAHIAVDIDQALDHASVVLLQEADSSSARVGLARALASHPGTVAWRAPTTTNRENVIVWRTRGWLQVGPGGWLRTHAGLRGVNPARYLTWQALRRRGTGVTLTLADTHAVNGYCTNRHGYQRWRDSRAAIHWHKVRDWTAWQRATHPRRPVVLGGDFNCSLRNRVEPFYPAPVLDPRYRLDGSRSLDHDIDASPRNTLAPLARWSRAAWSDHRLHLTRYRLTLA